MDKFRKFLHHRFNPLHVYCRLIDGGMERECALNRCKWYEQWIYNYVSKIPGFKIRNL